MVSPFFRDDCRSLPGDREFLAVLHLIGGIVPASMAGAVLLLFVAFFRATDRAAARAHGHAAKSEPVLGP